MKKIPVAVLGATGAVGQRMVQLLAVHPWFEIVQLCASEKNEGKRYADAVSWLLPDPIPSSVRSMVLTFPKPLSSAKIAFSALDSSVALSIEKEWAKEGRIVVTNAAPHRVDPKVPLVVPEINPDHIALVKDQGFPSGGMIVANPNCVTIGLTLALKPLVDLFGLKSVIVTTFQATSGAGFPGVSSLSILDNIVPNIPGEEEKIESEPKKIFARLDGTELIYSPIQISASSARVPVLEGHLKAVSVELASKATINDVQDAFCNYRFSIEDLALPSAPKRPIHFFSEPTFPQPRLHRMQDNGMGISVGGLRPCSVSNFKFFTLSHNTIRGAAGGSILLGELLVSQIEKKTP